LLDLTLSHEQVKLATLFSAGLLERMVALTESLLATLGDSPAVEAATPSRSGTKLGSRAPDLESRGNKKKAEILRFSSPVPDSATASPDAGIHAIQRSQGVQEGVAVAKRNRDIRQMPLARRFSRSVGGELLMMNATSTDSYLQVGICDPLRSPCVCIWLSLQFYSKHF
jgi:hypothetical protein